MSRFVIESAGHAPQGRFVIEEAEQPKRSVLEQLDAGVRGIADAATFGFSDEIAAAGDTYLNPWNDKSYGENVADQRGRDTQDSEDFPVTRFAGQIAGSLPTAIVPGLGAARVAAAARAGSGVIREGAKLGAKYGALYGAGSADPVGDEEQPASLLSAAGQRVAGAGIGAATGAVAGGVLAKGSQYLGKGYDPVRRAVYENASPRRAAETAFNRELQAGETSAAELSASILPGHKSLSTEQRVRAYEMLAEEMKSRPIGAKTRVAARMAQEFGGTAKTNADRLAAMSKRYDAQLGGSPLTLSELPSVTRANAALKKGGDVTDEMLTSFDETPTRALVDTIANSGGKAAARVQTSLANRQMGTRGRMQTALADAVGGREFGALAQGLDDQLSQQGSAAYKAAFAAERPVAPLLEQVMARVNHRIGARSGVVHDALLQARNEFYRELQVQGQPPVRQIVTSLQQAMDARGVLSDMVGEATRAGQHQIARGLQQMHREVTAALRHTNPQWWKANQIWGDAKSGQKAMELGEQLLARSGPQLRQTLATFDRMPPAMQERFRVAAMQRLHDALNNANDTVDLARIFRNQSMRDVLRHVFGDDTAGRLIRRVRDETIATSTNRLTGNSRTAVRGETRARLNEGTDIAGAAQMMSTGGIRGALMDRASRFLADRRNVPLADIAMTPVSRPEQLIPLLQRLQQAPARRPGAVAPQWAARGARVGAIANALGTDWSRR